ncbi:murein hydrolase activator EnvC family protein, partial [Phaeospirillum tilakii]
TPAPAAPAAASPVEAPPPPRAAGLFLWPLKGEVVAEFGPLPGKGQHNDGINIAAARGTPIRAAENGVVVYVGNELKGFGNLLLIKHADGWMTAYAHAEQLKVDRGARIKRGQVIATVGSSGNASQPQLHFEIRRGTEAVNPLDYLPERKR